MQPSRGVTTKGYDYRAIPRVEAKKISDERRRRGSDLDCVRMSPTTLEKDNELPMTGQRRGEAKLVRRRRPPSAAREEALLAPGSWDLHV
ncbi:hypothetical protein HYQ46_000356 [Verticillium longisporum]|nr:hypothetical protein HYQ46_000356 [Verticillium longisporum]